MTSAMFTAPLSFTSAMSGQSATRLGVPKRWSRRKTASPRLTIPLPLVSPRWKSRCLISMGVRGASVAPAMARKM